MKKLLIAPALLALAFSAFAAGEAAAPADPAMKEKCDKMMAEKADSKAMKEAGCPMAKKGGKKVKAHDHSKFHKNS